MDLREIQSIVQRWAVLNFPENQAWMPLVGLQEEVGELARAHLKMAQGIRGTPARWKDSKCDAVGDIIIYLANYCSLNDIDMNAALELALHEVLARDWIKFPGNGVDK